MKAPGQRGLCAAIEPETPAEWALALVLLIAGPWWLAIRLALAVF